LLSWRASLLRGELRDVAPSSTERVVVERLLSPALAVAQGIEDMRKLARGLAVASDPSQQLRSGALSAAVEPLHEMMGRLPHGRTAVRSGIPGRLALVTLEQPHLAPPRVQDARAHDPVDRHRARGCERLSPTVLALAEPVLLEPAHREAAVRVEVPLLL